MSRDILNLLNCKQHMRDHINDFIEAFVEFYGEDKREEIEKKFSKVLFVAYRHPSSTSRYLFELSKRKSTKLKNSIMHGIETELAEDDLFDNNVFKNIKITPIYQFKEFYDQYCVGKEGRLTSFINKSLETIQKDIPEFTKEDFLEIFRTGSIPKKYEHLKSWEKNNILYYTDTSQAEKEYKRKFDNIKNLLQKIDPRITMNNIDKYFHNPEIQNLIAMASKLDDAFEEYNKYMNQFSRYMTEADDYSMHRLRTNEKYYQLLIKESIDLIPENKREGLDEFLKDSKKSYLLDRFIQSTFGYDITSNSLFESFSKKADEKLKNSDSNWIKKEIIKNRIEYFQNLGFDISQPEDLEREEIKKVWPTHEQINKFMKIKNKLYNQYNIELYDNIPSQKEIKEEMDEKQLLDKDSILGADLYTSDFGTFMAPNIKKTDYGYELYSIIAINCSNNDNALDHNIVHEMNHLYELSLVNVLNNQYECYSGWDKCGGEINQEEKTVNTLNNTRELREYELFNEIINEVITQEICGIIKKNKKNIFNSNNFTISHTTSYEHTMFLVKDFYETFKDIIIESRANGNIEVIWNEVGKENFDELNDLFKEFNENFAGMKIYSVLNDVNKNIPSKEAKLYKSLHSRSQIILENMRNYKKIQELKGVTINEGINH